MRFSEKLARKRKENNLSQEQLAERLDVSRQAVSKWESEGSYPDMNKIIQICRVLDCTLDELLDDGLLEEGAGGVASEAGEKKKKSRAGACLQDFLDYVTKTCNMLIHMGHKGRIKCILEMLLAALIVCAAGALLFVMMDGITWQFLKVLPAWMSHRADSVFRGIYLLGLCVLGLVVWFHLFKIRYLDYYITVEDVRAREQTVEAPIEENQEGPVLWRRPADTKELLVIRDPKHSSQKFFGALGKVFGFCFKVFVILCALPAMFALIGSVAAAAACLWHLPYGILFLFTALIFVGFGLLMYMLVHMAFNYLTRRSQNTRYFLAILLSGLLLCGMGLGLGVSEFGTFTVIPREQGIAYTEKQIQLTDIRPGDEVDFEGPDHSLTKVADENAKGVTLTVSYPEDQELFMNDFEYRDEAGAVRGGFYFYSCYGNRTNGAFKLMLQDIKNKQTREFYTGYGRLIVTAEGPSELLDSILWR